MEPNEFILLVKMKIEKLSEHDGYIDEDVALEHETALLEIHESCEAYLSKQYDEIAI